MYEASFYQKKSDGSVTCSLCRHRCTVLPGKQGICHVRQNIEGTLVSHVYGRIVAEHVDPVEKKPLFHFLPGTATYSIATVGCNFSCKNCQNHSIAQYVPGADTAVPGRVTSAEDVVKRALESGCSSISYTYTEPTVFFEFMYDVARRASRAGLKNCMVTNGYITPEALDVLAPYLGAVNIDLKGFTANFYSRIAGSRLTEVLDCIRDFHRRNIWMEITSLIIPGENDSPDELDGMTDFIRSELSPDVPWHISRFFPQYRMTDREATPPDSLFRAVESGRRAGLRYIYVGNYDGGFENTLCPGCGAELIIRRGYRIISQALEDGRCRTCGCTVAGSWIIK